MSLNPNDGLCIAVGAALLGGLYCMHHPPAMLHAPVATECSARRARVEEEGEGAATGSAGMYDELFGGAAPAAPGVSAKAASVEVVGMALTAGEAIRRKTSNRDDLQYKETSYGKKKGISVLAPGKCSEEGKLPVIRGDCQFLFNATEEMMEHMQP
jgi:hypothetical protein